MYSAKYWDLVNNFEELQRKWDDLNISYDGVRFDTMDRGKLVDRAKGLKKELDEAKNELKKIKDGHSYYEMVKRYPEMKKVFQNYAAYLLFLEEEDKYDKRKQDLVSLTAEAMSNGIKIFFFQIFFFFFKFLEF